MGILLAKMKWVLVLGIFVTIAACAGQQLATPDKLVAPVPVAGNSGKYMCPYNSDGVMCEWTDKAMNAKMGSAVGSTLGAYAGSKALEQIPFVGGFLGQQAGDAIGRKIAIESAGGMDFIKEKSDISFDSVDDMAVFLYVKHSTHEHYQSALSAAMEIYPEFKQRYQFAIYEASRKAMN